MRSVSTISIAILVFVATAWLPAQPPQLKPGPEHEFFKQFEGTWDATIHEKDATSKGTMQWKIGLGGLWLLEHFKAEMGGEAVLAEIRAITDARPTYGYRRVTALLNRARRSSGEPPLNHMA